MTPTVSFILGWGLLFFGAVGLMRAAMIAWRPALKRTEWSDWLLEHAMRTLFFFVPLLLAAWTLGI